MKILFLPIDIEVPKIDMSKLKLADKKKGRYQPYWQTNDIIEITDDGLKSLLDQLPFEKLTNLYFKKQTRAALPHYDVYPDMHFAEGEYEHILKNEPAGYRIVLTGTNDKIFVKSQGKFKPALLPSIPSCYLLNSTEGLHMVNFDSERYIIYLRGFLDYDKHQSLIDKSLNRYSNLAIVEN